MVIGVFVFGEFLESLVVGIFLVCEIGAACGVCRCVRLESYAGLLARFRLEGNSSLIVICERCGWCRVFERFRDISFNGVVGESGFCGPVIAYCALVFVGDTWSCLIFQNVSQIENIVGQGLTPGLDIKLTDIALVVWIIRRTLSLLARNGLLSSSLIALCGLIGGLVSPDGLASSRSDSASDVRNGLHDCG